MITGTIWTVAGVIWVAGSYWQKEARQPVMAVMHIAIGALNIAVGAMFLAAA